MCCQVLQQLLNLLGGPWLWRLHPMIFCSCVCVCVSVVPLGLQIVLRVAREEQTVASAEAETRGGSKKGAREWKVLGLVGGDLAPFAGNVNSIAMRPSTQNFVLLGLQMVLRVAREEQAGAGAEAETRGGSGKEEFGWGRSGTLCW